MFASCDPEVFTQTEHCCHHGSGCKSEQRQRFLIGKVYLDNPVPNMCLPSLQTGTCWGKLHSPPCPALLCHQCVDKLKQDGLRTSPSFLHWFSIDLLYSTRANSEFCSKASSLWPGPLPPHPLQQQVPPFPPCRAALARCPL